MVLYVTGQILYVLPQDILFLVEAVTIFLSFGYVYPKSIQSDLVFYQGRNSVYILVDTSCNRNA